MEEDERSKYRTGLARYLVVRFNAICKPFPVEVELS
jgi:hypothetical protein